MAVNNNADDYANSRLGIFFHASSNGTLEDGDLTGQCVSLAKWFISEMAGVPNPGQARGNAKDFGDTLVAQGYATVVTSPARGDLAIWKKDGGGYGHVGVVLSNSTIFEENAAIAGTASKKVPYYNPNGTIAGYSTVYASRTDPMNASWRVGSPTFYRLNGYKEVTPAPSAQLKPAKGTAVVTVDELNVRNAPTTSSSVQALYSRGDKFNYDNWCANDGYIWLSYLSYSGVRRYVAEGPDDGKDDTVYVTGGV